jgi:hypothetical protein
MMSITGYWGYLAYHGLVKTQYDAAILQKIDEICEVQEPSEEQFRIKNLAYWFECQFECPSTDKKTAEYFRDLFSATEAFLNNTNFVSKRR